MPEVHQPLPAALATDRIARICAERGVKFTPLRRIAFEVLLEFNGPVGAYGLIRALKRRHGKRVAPPTAYRALEFLQEQGFVIRIERRNAFLPSADPEAPGSGAFFLCNRCGATAETEVSQLEAELIRRSQAIGFQIGRRVVELQGTCADCLRTAMEDEGQDRAVKDGRG
ncbi:Fur family transcriptional regulator [Paenirhodobacter populi]|nr:transcriptional repressor [Sinirhodobacter populi]